MSTQTQIATVTATIAPAFVCERPISAIAKDFTFDKSDGVKVGNKVTVQELGFYMATTMQEQESINRRMANCLRHARALSPVEVDVRDKHGDVTGAKLKVTAFNWLKEKLRANANTAGTFANMFQLVEALDFIADNGLPSGLSPYSVKNALGYFREHGALPKPDKSKEYKAGDLKLKDVAFCAPLVKALHDCASQPKIEIARTEAEKLRVPPVAPVATVVPTVPTVPTEGGAPQAPATPASATPAPATPAPVKATQTPEMILGDLVTICGNWQIAMEQGASREDMRKVCADKVKELALLAGWKCVKAE